MNTRVHMDLSKLSIIISRNILPSANQTKHEIKQVESQGSTAKKSVTFNDKMRVRIIAPICLYSQAEIDACWTTEEDDDQSKRHVAKTLKAVRNGQLCTNNDVGGEMLCPRGLENLFSEKAHQQLIETRHRVSHAVKIEQDRQWAKGLDNSERIAEASARKSLASGNKALVAAAVDASAVRRSSMKQRLTSYM
jgi:hypothetical protein